MITIPRSLRAGPLDHRFEAFGQILAPPATGRLNLVEELTNSRPTARPRLTVTKAPMLEDAFAAVQMERHAFSAQAFMPMDVSRYVIMVAPPSDGGPDPDRIRAFVVDGHVGILYAAGVWHHPIRALDRPGSFAVLTFVDGTADDELFVPLPEPIAVRFD